MKTEQILSALSHESIARRARELWHQLGAPAGQDLDIWLQAERELSSQVREPATELDYDRLREFLDTFGNTSGRRGPTSLSLT